MGVQNILGGHKFLERKIGGHKIFDDQNVVSHKMTTDSVFTLFIKTDFDTILACLGGKVYQWWGVIKFLMSKYGGSQFYQHQLFVNLGPPSEENDSPQHLCQLGYN